MIYFVSGVFVFMHDLTGREFGQLIILRRSEVRAGKVNKHTQWVCLCSCGKETTCRTSNLLKGMTKSCGCLKHPNLLGMRFSRLLVTAGPVHKEGIKHRGSYWECLCDCQRTVILQGSHLKAGSTKSCGCLHREMLPSTKYLPNDHFVVKELRKSAKDRNLDCDLTDMQITHLVHQNCYYCGTAPGRVVTPPHRKVPVDFSYNGIDRIDSLKGYIAGNVVSCCTQCNYAKRNYSSESFIEMCRKIAERHPRADTSAGASAGLL